MTTTDATPSRVSDIARQIRNAVNPLIGALTDKADANKALQDASAAATNTRETIQVVLAAASVTGSWTIAEIDAAAGAAAAMSNNKDDKAIATFIGECKKAMDPDVRHFVDDLRALRTQVWDAEKADKDGEKPCAKAFARGYHMLQRMMEHLRKEHTLLTTPAEVVAWAQALDPDKNPDKAYDRLQKLRKELQAIVGVFPIGKLTKADELLATIDRATFNGNRKAEPAKPTTNVVPISPPAAVAPEPIAPEPVTTTTVVEGAYDPIADALDNFAGMEMAALGTAAA